MKNTLSVLIIFFAMISIVTAQKPPHKKHSHKAKLPVECKQELQKYYEESIYPIMQTAHSQFVDALTADDLEFINAKRSESKQLHQEKKEAYHEIRKAWKEGASKEELKTKKQAIHATFKEKLKALAVSMKPFLERNQEVIESAMTPIKKAREEWKETKESIIAKHLTEEQKIQKEEHKLAMQNRKEKHPEKAAKHHKKRHAMAITKFVLWDSEEKQDVDKNSPHTTTHDFDISTVVLSNYPNPANKQTTINIVVSEKQTNALLFITDAQGKKVWNKTLNTLETGEYNIEVNLANFEAGQYFYTLETNGTKTSKSILIQ